MLVIYIKDPNKKLFSIASILRPRVTAGGYRVNTSYMKFKDIPLTEDSLEKAKEYIYEYKDASAQDKVKISKQYATEINYPDELYVASSIEKVCCNFGFSNDVKRKLANAKDRSVVVIINGHIHQYCRVFEEEVNPLDGNTLDKFKQYVEYTDREINQVSVVVSSVGSDESKTKTVVEVYISSLADTRRSNIAFKKSFYKSNIIESTENIFSSMNLEEAPISINDALIQSVNRKASDKSFVNSDPIVMSHLSTLDNTPVAGKIAWGTVYYKSGKIYLGDSWISEINDNTVENFKRLSNAVVGVVTGVEKKVLKPIDKKIYE